MPETTTTLEQSLEIASDLLISDPAEALQQILPILRDHPSPRALRLSAAALRALGRSEEAARAELEAINVGFPEALKAARLAQQARRSAEARALAEDYLRDNPDDLLAMTIAGEAALGLRRAEEAEAILRPVVDRVPAFAPASLLLANALLAQLRVREAAEIAENLLKRLPGEPGVKRYLADRVAQMNDAARAAALYEEVLAANADNPADLFKYAQNLRAAGRRTESVAALRRATKLAPQSGHAWWALAHYFPEELNDGDEAQIRAALALPRLPEMDRTLLNFAISVFEHRQGSYAAAFEAIAAAKAASSQSYAYNPQELSRHVDELIGAFTPPVFAQFQPYGSESDAPIFIVGLPRSGSTLLERILGRHSNVESLGEIRLIPRLLAAEQPDGRPGYRSLLPNSLSGTKVSEMARWYLARSEDYRKTSKPRFIDKYNANWLSTGLIRLMFPNAKILDVRRTGLDCCWSVFKTMLADEYASDQRYLARYYADYVRFMDAMAAASPSAVLTVNYEDLVADLEGQTRRILDFLGLEFERECVDFHLSDDAVATASSEQVRRPINSESVGSAEPYRQWLQPLIEELDSALANKR